MALEVLAAIARYVGADVGEISDEMTIGNDLMLDSLDLTQIVAALLDENELQLTGTAPAILDESVDIYDLTIMELQRRFNDAREHA